MFGAEDGKTAYAIVVLRDMWTHASPPTPTPPLADLGRPWPLFPVRPTDQELPDPTFSATRALPGLCAVSLKAAACF